MSGRLYAGPTLQAFSNRKRQPLETAANRWQFKGAKLKQMPLNASGQFVKIS